MVTQDVGKLRQVLDYWSCETCLDVYSPEQDYLCGICARLNRDVVIKKSAVGTDEAVQVIDPGEFHMAKDLRDRLQSQEVELVETRDRLSQLQARENDLQEKLRLLQEELEDAKRQKEEAALVPFEFVGVKGEGEDVVEFEEQPAEPAPAEWDSATPGEEPNEFTVAPTEDTEAVETAPSAPEWETVADEEPVEAEPEAFMPSAPMEPTAPKGGQRRGQAADDAIARIEAEIAKIEAELTQLATDEKSASGRSTPKKGKAGRRKSRR